MGEIAKSLWEFGKSAWYVLGVLVGVLVDPAHLAVELGWIPNSSLTVAAARWIGGSLLVIVMFVWFHRQRMAFRPVLPQRDKRIAEALCYARFGSWGRFPNQEGGMLDEQLWKQLDLIEEAASEGRIQFWGKASRHMNHQKIDKEFWEGGQKINLTSFLGREEGVKTNSIPFGPVQVWDDLMVSKAQFEREFPRASSRRGRSIPPLRGPRAPAGG